MSKREREHDVYVIVGDQAVYVVMGDEGVPFEHAVYVASVHHTREGAEQALRELGPDAEFGEVRKMKVEP